MDSNGFGSALARARAGSRRPFIVLVLKAVSQPGWIRMDSAALQRAFARVVV